MEIVFYFIVLIQTTLIFSLIAYKFFLNPYDEDFDWLRRERGRIRNMRRRGRKVDEEEEGEGESALILFDENYQNYIQQQNGPQNQMRTEGAYDDVDDISAYCMEQSLKYKDKKKWDGRKSSASHLKTL